MNKILDGMNLIAKYEPDATCSAKHDVLYFGSYEDTYLQMTEEERKQMEEWGWFEEEESWTHFT